MKNEHHPITMVNRKQFWMLFGILFLGLSFMKMPQVLLQGRLWAEEGSVFMQDMQTRTLLEAVSYNYRGSIQLITALACWFATRVNIASMPYVTTYVAFGVSFILFIQMTAFAKRFGRSLFIIVTFLVGWMFLPETYEVWLTSTNIQWLCSLSLLMILLQKEDIIKSHLGVISVWVLLCGITGVPSCMLAPGFLVKGAVRRSIIFGSLGGLLAVSTAIQVAAILSTDFKGRPFELNIVDVLTSIAVGTIIQPILTVKLTNMITSIAVINNLLVTMSIIAISLAPFVYKDKDERNTSLTMHYLVGCWFLVTGLNVVGSLSGASILSSAPLVGSRYFFFGASCLLIALLLMSSSDRRWLRLLSTGLLIFIAANGVGQRLFSSWPGFFLTGPSWAEQVRRCPDHQICSVRIWPATNPPSEILLSAGSSN